MACSEVDYHYFAPRKRTECLYIVQTQVDVTDLARCHGFSWYEQLGIDVVQVPLEWLAAELPAQFLASWHIPIVTLTNHKSHYHNHHFILQLCIIIYIMYIQSVSKLLLQTCRGYRGDLVDKVLIRHPCPEMHHFDVNRFEDRNTLGWYRVSCVSE